MTTPKTTAHTPGIWRIGRAMANDGGVIICHDCQDRPHSQIAVVASQIERTRKTPYDAPDAERDANAQLLACAPELLEALKNFIADHHIMSKDGNCPCNVCRMGKVALTRATTP
jgi:hypothetical protein